MKKWPYDFSPHCDRGGFGFLFTCALINKTGVTQVTLSLSFLIKNDGMENNLNVC